MKSEFKGIDISSHNGAIDFAKVKASGIDFAILRAGYGNDNPAQDDKRFNEYVQGCEANGIPWGAYLYSYATTVEEAKSEAAHMLRLLKDKKPSYPVYIDMEDADGYKAKRGITSRRLLTDICLTFCDIISRAGYVAGTYANKDWMENKLYAREINKYSVWLAIWYDPSKGKPSYVGGTYEMWQYTSDGKVNGINGRVDMNISYRNFNPQPKPDPKPDPHGLKAGDKVTYKGRLYATSFGGVAGKEVNGVFTVSRVIQNRSHGVLLNNGLGWVAEKDCTLNTDKPAPPPAKIEKGDRVLLLSSATHYATGEKIPKKYTNKKYTVAQTSPGKVRLQELNSWVVSKDVRKA